MHIATVMIKGTYSGARTSTSSPIKWTASSCCSTAARRSSLSVVRSLRIDDHANGAPAPGPHIERGRIRDAGHFLGARDIIGESDGARLANRGTPPERGDE